MAHYDMWVFLHILFNFVRSETQPWFGTCPECGVWNWIQGKIYRLARPNCFRWAYLDCNLKRKKKNWKVFTLYCSHESQSYFKGKTCYFFFFQLLFHIQFQHITEHFLRNLVFSACPAAVSSGTFLQLGPVVILGLAPISNQICFLWNLSPKLLAFILKVCIDYCFPPQWDFPFIHQNKCVHCNSFKAPSCSVW